MTSEESFPTNQAMIIGRLGGFIDYRSKDRTPSLKTISKRGDFGRVTQFMVSLETAFGEPFDLLMEAGASTKGMEILESTSIGEFVVVEGAALLGTEVDRRYAVSDEDSGRAVRDMVIHVSSIRTPRPDENEVKASVKLEGVVREPAAWQRHARYKSAEFGRTIFRTTIGVHRLPVDVPILISTEHNHAGYIYHAGNKLRLEGDITRVLSDQSGKAVDAAVQRLDDEWSAQKSELSGKNQAEQRVAHRRYQSRRESLTKQARTYVLIREVDPQYGAQPISVEQARTERREFVDSIRRRGRQGATERIQPHVVASHQGSAVEASEIPVAAPAPVEVAPAAEPLKPRRRERVEEPARMPTQLISVEGLEPILTTNGHYSEEDAVE